MRRVAAVSAMLVFSLAHAGEYAVDIKSDHKDSRFFIVEKGGPPGSPVLVVKRVSGSVARYSSREFDCKARTVRTLGRGASLEELQTSEPEKDAYPIAAGSIDDQLSRHACPK